MKNTKRSIWVFIMVATMFSGCGKEPVAVPTISEAIVEEKPFEELISIVAVGDNLLHMPVVNSGKKDDGTYDYSQIFSQLQPRFKDADLAVIGQETVFAGKDAGYSGYPLFNSPSDMGKTLVNQGFDVVLHASNHILDRGSMGVENTLSFWDEYPDITVLGINKTAEDKEIVDIINVKGAKLAVLNYTYSTNGISLPAGKEHLVNYIDEEKMEKDITYAEKNADFTIAFMHWGTEYSFKPDEWQKTLCNMMCENGVDLIIGSHPHVIEPVEWYTADNGNKMLVYYSLGNFVSRQLEAKNLLGGLANVNLLYNGEEVLIKDYTFMPIVTHYNTAYNVFDVYPLKEYTNDLAQYHGVAPHDGAVSVERYKKIVDGVFEGYNANCVDY